jgi:hypothetical protein
MEERGRPPTTVAVCHEIHDLLLEKGIGPGSKVPRPLWDDLVMRAVQVSYPQSRNITKTGVGLGLWQSHSGHGLIPGSVVLLPPVVA